MTRVIRTIERTNGEAAGEQWGPGRSRTGAAATGQAAGSVTGGARAGGRNLIRRLRAREREIEEAIFTRVSSMFMAALGEDADYEAGLRNTVATVVHHTLTAMEDPTGQPAPIPSAAIAQAHRAARRNISVDTMLLRYLGGHRVLGAFVMDEAHRGGLASNGPFLRHLRTTQEAVLERLMTRIADEHRQERERIDAHARSAMRSWCRSSSRANVPTPPTSTTISTMRGIWASSPTARRRRGRAQFGR